MKEEDESVEESKPGTGEKLVLLVLVERYRVIAEPFLLHFYSAM